LLSFLFQNHQWKPNFLLRTEGLTMHPSPRQFVEDASIFPVFITQQRSRCFIVPAEIPTSDNAVYREFKQGW